MPAIELSTSHRFTPYAFRFNRFTAAVCVVVFIALLDHFLLDITRHTARILDLQSSFVGAAVLWAVAAGLKAATSVTRYRAGTRLLRFDEIARTMGWILVLESHMLVLCILSYLSAALDAPLIENSLVRFDRALGFSWPTVYQWVHAHSAIQSILQFAYHSVAWQVFVVPVALGMLGRRKDISDFVLLFMLASLIVTVISTPFPASSAFVHFGISDPYTASTVSDFALLRDGTLRNFDLTRMQGLVSMPSFHTAVAVIFAYSVRRISWLFAFALPLNAVMILSTPTQGGHYLADVLAGLLTSVVSVLILNRLSASRTAHTGRVSN